MSPVKTQDTAPETPDYLFSVVSWDPDLKKMKHPVSKGKEKVKKETKHQLLKGKKRVGSQIDQVSKTAAFCIVSLVRKETW